jgi:GH15 family glucan-1,4-alpha-glucosidase
MEKGLMPGRIEDYAMVGDLQTAALVGSDGSVDWLCFPCFDSPASFAALLGEDTNGRWRIAPTSGGRCTRRRYRGHTLVLETEWETQGGAVRVLDCMPPRGVAPDLVRVVEGVRGKVSFTSELRIRFDYGHVAPWVTIQGREVRAVAGPDALWLRASGPHEEVGGEILFRFTVSEGERVPLVLTWSPSYAERPLAIDGLQAVDDTERFWLDWAGGISYEGASPVRIGNDAAGQVQGDVPGEVLAAAHVGRTAGIVSMERGWELQRWLAGRLQEAWKRPDNGIWESRGERQHFVYSKVMCWVAFDCLVKGVERFGLDGPVERWRTVRDEIHSDILEKGYDAGRGTFTQAYGSSALDACALLIPRVGFLPYDDERVVSTIETIRNELTEDGLVLRYRTDQSDDGLTGREGSFLICSFWMVYALWGIGRHREAEELFERLLALRNDVGLLSEEYDTRAQRLVGNFPQAFTHLALVNCALRLSDREVSIATRE